MLRVKHFNTVCYQFMRHVISIRICAHAYKNIVYARVVSL